MPSLVLPAGEALVALGSNLGDREAHLAFGLAGLADLALGPLRRSRLYDTAPVGPPQPRYLNAAVRLRTALGPEALLEALLAIERARGRDRTREARHGPRVLDLDLLLHGAERRTLPHLTVPHPRLLDRPFVLAPLCDVVQELPALAPRLAALGGPPPVVPWPDERRS